MATGVVLLTVYGIGTTLLCVVVTRPPPPIPPPPPERVRILEAAEVSCSELDRERRALFQLPATAPTYGAAPSNAPGLAPREADAVRDEAEKACVGDRACFFVPEKTPFRFATRFGQTTDPKFAIVVFAKKDDSRNPKPPEATLRIAANADGVGVPLFASDALVHDGDVIPTLWGAARAVAVRPSYYDHGAFDGYVALRLVDGNRPADTVDPLRFFVGPNVGALVDGYRLDFQWKGRVAHVVAQRLPDVGLGQGVEPRLELDVRDALVLGHHRYRVIDRHAPTAIDRGWLEFSARPETLPDGPEG